MKFIFKAKLLFGKANACLKSEFLITILSRYARCHNFWTLIQLEEVLFDYTDYVLQYLILKAIII